MCRIYEFDFVQFPLCVGLYFTVFSFIKSFSVKATLYLRGKNILITYGAFTNSKKDRYSIICF